MEFEDDQNNQEGDQQGAVEDFFQEYENDITNPDIIQKKDAVIFLIDCKKSVFNKPPESQYSPFEEVILSFISFLKAKIISNIDDKIGLLFYNVKNSNNPLKFKGLNLVYNLDSPSAERIKKSPELIKKFEELYGFSEDTALHEALWVCNNEFKEFDKNKYSMRIFLFTDEDNPHSGDNNLRDKVLNQANQLRETDVQIELFPLKKLDGTNFDIKKFYFQIISFDLDEINQAAFDQSNKISNLQVRMRQKEYKKRTLNRIMFELGNDVKVGVKLFCTYNKAKKPIATKLERETNKPVKAKTKFLCTETGADLYQEQIGTYFPLGGEKIPISKQEMKEIKSFEKPGMRLMGFKPKSKLKIYYNFRPSYFIYPDEERVKGSSQLFHALINQMIVKDKVAIARFLPREGGQLRFCALIPQEESYDENHFQTPAGLNLIYLPYADDLRSLKNVKPNNQVTVSRDLINVTKMLINSLQVDFDPRNFEDPSLQQFYSYLQAHALNEEDAEAPKDLLEPDEEGFNQQKEVVDLFMEALNLEAKTNIQEKSPIKVEYSGVLKEQGNRGRGRGQNQGGMEEETKKQTKKQSKKGGKGQPNSQKKPRKKKIKQGEEDLEGDEQDSRELENDYDFSDSFLVDDRNKKSKKNQQEKTKNKGDDLEDLSAGDNLNDEDQDQDYQSKKKDKKNNDTEDIILATVESALLEGEVDNLKTEDLKTYLKSKKLKTTGKKADLVERALDYCSQKK